MAHTPSFTKPRSAPWLMAFLFALCYTQPFHLYSNQNQYYLHAIAVAGEGDLPNDWLANTADPTPLFSWIVSLMWKWFGLWPMHTGMFALAMVYFLSLWQQLEKLGKLPASTVGRWLFAALFTASHAGIFRFVSDRLLGADYPWFLQCGLANQYLLGPGLQPSVFGVFLLTALALYAKDRPFAAVLVACSVNAVHATYLLASVFLVAGFMVAEMRRGRTWSVVALGSLALAIVPPMVVFMVMRFWPSDAGNFEASQRILSDVRIPHHTKPVRWFDSAAAGQLILMAIGLGMAFRTRLLVPLAVAACLAIMGTAVVLANDSPTLELLFPWRISAVFVPVSTAFLAAWIANKLERFRRLAIGSTIVLLTVGMLGAVAIYTLGLGYREPPSEDEVLEYVRANHQPGELYLIPARFPKPNPPRGVYSNTFTAPLGPNDVVHFELARFRAATGAALYVDFKSIPYKDVDVLEWNRRVGQCVAWFGSTKWNGETIAELRKEGITHVVAPAKLGLESPGLQLVETAGAYRMYRVR